MKRISGIVDVPGMGQNLTDTVLTDVKNYRGDYMTDIIILVDASWSIANEWKVDYSPEIKRALVNIKNALLNTKEADSIRVCVMHFGERVPTQLDFVPLDKMDTSYTADQGQTRIYQSLCVANNLLLQHVDAMEKKNVYVTAQVMVMTDGANVGGWEFEDDAKDVVKSLHGKETIFSWICIGPKAQQCARGLGLFDREILTVEKTDDPHEFRQHVAMASASAIAQSQKAAGVSSTASSGAASAALKWAIDD